MKKQEQNKMKNSNNRYADCSFCGGEVTEQKTELDYRYKGQLFIFRNVPAGVCAQCGEKYLMAQTTKEIEQKINTKEEWGKTIEVPVDDFNVKAA